MFDFQFCCCNSHPKNAEIHINAPAAPSRDARDAEDLQDFDEPKEAAATTKAVEVSQQVLSPEQPARNSKVTFRDKDSRDTNPVSSPQVKEEVKTQDADTTQPSTSLMAKSEEKEMGEDTDQKAPEPKESNPKGSTGEEPVAAPAAEEPAPPRTAPYALSVLEELPAAAAAAGCDRQYPRWREFDVQVEKPSESADLALDIDSRVTSCLAVVRVKPGVVQSWNEDNPSHVVRGGDTVVAINGVSGSLDVLRDEIHKNYDLKLRVRRTDEFEVVLEKTEWANSLGLDLDVSRMRVHKVKDGLVLNYNINLPSKSNDFMIIAGDAIVEVNGYAGSSERALEQIKTERRLHLVIAKAGASK
eukprot:TRINITY_DN14281_c0_g1_i1.p1 TRINITY_DN14281_c0_g1~~TRINITY_DN14281_c0_g1_i1.p1  ORF type:complete len:358 (+),score=90.18 TRINITY_DN14281_c0_g1_i1:77-1150(+)